MQRIFSLDFLRGLTIILMIIFNYSVTLTYFQIISLPYDFLYWFVFPRLIGGTFIFISGIAAYVSYKNSRQGFDKKYFRRGLKLLVFAATITVFTYFFVPQGIIFFGILHFFAFTSFLLPFIIKYDKLNLFAGILIALFGIYLQLTSFNFSYLFWLGFMQNNFVTFDYFPLIPWLGVLMLGIYFGKTAVKKISKFKISNPLGSLFAFLGRNSLTIYLLHQPILILILLMLGFRLFF